MDRSPVKTRISLAVAHSHRRHNSQHGAERRMGGCAHYAHLRHGPGLETQKKLAGHSPAWQEQLSPHCGDNVPSSDSPADHTRLRCRKSLASHVLVGPRGRPVHEVANRPSDSHAIAPWPSHVLAAIPRQSADRGCVSRSSKAINRRRRNHFLLFRPDGRQTEIHGIVANFTTGVLGTIAA